MNILMLTNTYLPHVGGVATSVDRTAAALRARGHAVHIIAPDFDGQEEDESVTRVPAIQNFNGSDFSVRIPIPGYVHGAIEQFEPQIVHSHHPFLLGDTAVRIAAWRLLPLVFTHHTRYEDYVHYVPFNSANMRQFVRQLAVEYSNLADLVVAPSESIAQRLAGDGVKSEVKVIPTGVDCDRFAAGDGRRGRERLGVDDEALVIGYVGRLAEEKNLLFLSLAVSRVMKELPDARFLAVGNGPAEETMREQFESEGLGDRVVFAGSLSGEALIDAYHAMDIFAFASLTETQGMVLAEAMSAGVPVVALEASGTREIMADGGNGRLVAERSPDAMARALLDVASRLDCDASTLRRAVWETARRYSIDRSAASLEAAYGRAIQSRGDGDEPTSDTWARLLNLIEQEWNMWSSRLDAARA